jgi:type I restriction enzyme S subunit
MELLERHFDTAFDAPDGIKKLRELILTLAMQGKLVPQDPNDLPASELLKEIEAEKKRLTKEGKIRSPKSMLPIPIEEGPFPLPNGWVWARFASLATEIATGPFGSMIHQSDYVTGGVPLVNPSHMISGRIIHDPEIAIPKSMANELQTYSLHVDDIVMARRGEMGRCALVTAAEHGFLCGTGSFILRFISKIDRKYILYFFRTGYCRDHLGGRSVGITMTNLNQGILEATPIPVAPAKEQHRIVARFDELMARCDALENLRAERDAKRGAVHTAALRQLLNVTDTDGHIQAREFLGQHFGELYTVKENVTELRKAILYLAVMGKLVPQDPNDAPASELLKQIEAEKKRLVKKGEIKEPKPLPPLTRLETPYEIPQSWQWVRMGELCNGITSGSTPSKEHIHDKDGIPFLKVYNIRNQMIDFAYKKQFVSRNYHQKTMARSRLTPGDVVMNIVGPPLGKTAIIPDEYQEYNCNQAIVVFRPIARATNRYLHAYLLAGRFLEGIELVGTAGQDNISVTKSQMMPIPLPPMEEQLRIVKCVRTLIGQCDTLEQQIDAARESQSALLNAMMAQYGEQQCA